MPVPSVVSIIRGGWSQERHKLAELILSIFSNCTKSIWKRLKLSFEKFEAQYFVYEIIQAGQFPSELTHLPISQTFIQDFDSGIQAYFQHSLGAVAAESRGVIKSGSKPITARGYGERC